MRGDEELIMLRLWQLSQVWTWWCWSSPPTTSRHLSSWWAEPAVHHFLGGTMARRLEWFVRGLRVRLLRARAGDAGGRLAAREAAVACWGSSQVWPAEWARVRSWPSLRALRVDLVPPVTQTPWQGKALACLSSCERWWQWGEVEWRHKEVAVNLVFHQQEVFHNSITSFCLSEMIAEKYLIWVIWSHHVTILAQKGNI